MRNVFTVLCVLTLVYVCIHLCLNLKKFFTPSEPNTNPNPKHSSSLLQLHISTLDCESFDPGYVYEAIARGYCVTAYQTYTQLFLSMTFPTLGVSDFPPVAYVYTYDYWLTYALIQVAR